MHVALKHRPAVDPRVHRPLALTGIAVANLAVLLTVFAVHEAGQDVSRALLGGIDALLGFALLLGAAGFVATVVGAWTRRA